MVRNEEGGISSRPMVLGVGGGIWSRVSWLGFQMGQFQLGSEGNKKSKETES